MPSRKTSLSKAYVSLIALLIAALNFSSLFPTRAQTQTPAQPPAAQADGDAKKSVPDKPQEKPFADVIKDMEAVPGLFTLYRKDDKVYIEILPDQLDKVYLLSSTRESGIGERGILSSQMMGASVFSFRKFGKNIQLVEKNAAFRAADGSPISRAVKRSFSDSVIGLAKIESLPHPERNSVLIDLGALLLTDLPQISYRLEATFRLPYRFDSKNSGFGKIKGFPKNVEIEMLTNYAVERPSLPPLPGPTPAPPLPEPPLTPPDLRSIQLQLRYSLSTLPESNYKPRLADDRVGHFTDLHQDYTDDAKAFPDVHYVNRWNLEKADPAAALSAPKQPIVYWLENTVPVKYRKAVIDGVLVWNKAFEKIGFKDAVVVKQQPDDADWDPADVRYNTIRWFVATDAAFAIGPSRSNPFTGEIYDADIGFSESMTRFNRRSFRELIQPLAEIAESEQQEMLKGDSQCSLASGILREASFGFDMLISRGLLEPGSEEAERFTNDFLTHVTAHEVGHTLGLRHNFYASSVLPFEKLNDVQTTSESGLTGSVMDYIPVNIAPKDVKQGQYWQTTIGAYDYWAIEYAYKPINAGSPEEELPELQKIASLVADPKLAYGTDEDAFGNSPVGINPLVNLFDMGADPVKFYGERMKLVSEHWKNIETKIAKPGDGYQTLRYSFNRGFGEMYTSLMNATKFIGGIYHRRDHIGDPGNRLPYEPVSAEKQRKALELLQTYAFGKDSFTFSPTLLNKLAIDRLPTFGSQLFSVQRLDYPIHDQVLALQRALLNRLYNPIVLSRLVDLEVKYPNPNDKFLMPDLFDGLQSSIWSELKDNGKLNINGFRRALQREHLKDLARFLHRPAPNTPEDATTMARANLIELKDQIKKSMAGGKARMDRSTWAHLQESEARIDEALKAQQPRLLN